MLNGIIIRSLHHGLTHILERQHCPLELSNNFEEYLYLYLVYHRAKKQLNHYAHLQKNQP